MCAQTPKHANVPMHGLPQASKCKHTSLKAVICWSSSEATSLSLALSFSKTSFTNSSSSSSRGRFLPAQTGTCTAGQVSIGEMHACTQSVQLYVCAQVLRPSAKNLPSTCAHMLGSCECAKELYRSIIEFKLSASPCLAVTHSPMTSFPPHSSKWCHIDTGPRPFRKRILYAPPVLPLPSLHEGRKGVHPLPSHPH